jgi:deoxyribodipyrimidine photolyase-related protein
MEIRTETDYVAHHIQKVVGTYSAMRNFSDELNINNHQVIYIKLVDENNLQSFENIQSLIAKHFTHFEYQLQMNTGLMWFDKSL